MTNLRYRCIAPDWLVKSSPVAKVIEGEDLDIEYLNKSGYNIYWLPNYPSTPVEGNADGTHIDTWEYVYVDMDLKDGAYTSKEEFGVILTATASLKPTYIVDSGNGVHAYWRVTDLNAMDCLRLCRRLVRKFKTDQNVGKLYQLMRAIGTMNTKDESNFKLCSVLFASGAEYTCEDLDKALPRITAEDEAYCKRHYDSTYNIKSDVKVDDKLPLKFMHMLRSNEEVKKLWAAASDDRSRADFRLTHLLWADGFTRDEALSVLVNCAKAVSRAPHHRINYALQLIEKVYLAETEGEDVESLSYSADEYLDDPEGDLSTRLNCHPVFEVIDHGFRTTELIGLIGGTGSGKTTLALNYFYHFAQRNPEFIHFFCSLEQPAIEVAKRWDKICKGNRNLHKKIHVIGNYDKDGTYRNLGLKEIEQHIIAKAAKLGKRVGCVVLDHVGILKRPPTKDGGHAGLVDVYHGLKSFAVRTKTLVIAQSQTSREKAGNGDVELDKSSAFGSSVFDWYCDLVLTTWQPLRGVYKEAPEMATSAVRYCKIRHKNLLKDRLKEDELFVLKFDPETELLREMTQAEEGRYSVLLKKATALRNKDKKREPTEYVHIDWAKETTE